MNVEVEVKIEIDNFEEIKAKVATMGKLIKSIKQVDDYFVPCHKDFFAQKPITEWLRIRTNPDKVIFEYDRSVGLKKATDYDYAEEYETVISNPDEFRKILEFLNFEKVTTVDKQREYWDCGNIEVALDKIESLGHFIEAEAKGDFKDSIEAKQVCLDFLKSLGLQNVEAREIHEGYPTLLIKKLK